jgi:hypothetical protein
MLACLSTPALDDATTSLKKEIESGANEAQKREGEEKDEDDQDSMS